ncbi:preprotein translocase subunit YajC [Lentilactobacillus otakiensis]|uniref:Preprotein translocase subunit YajC n=1 Tax=Lentilactobacillus otakiensis DSM 19908 = JCM 15040 TaxID=1423780 RepID=S4NPI6_9LACO|nr:preprotein translocase subunit YajC [Lentilactobacillus otakiensis]KRL09037.1 preprotein translocase subunit YajC [Lentilactobacillus otakiensis DSM 19908 = JCM 15040]MBZ3775652.1 preprotein translocase subunit YajC [Lentilactobacillus otakiensis]MDV3518871.1 preprotein translocase subunit YajC [Lentilactobacillus otakiensis]GAD15968.1 preprotein translocase subunit YajC [Lentilactobacillus otakiensis DSM 19908 = JCM 15040]
MIVALFAVMYFVMVRPQRKQQQKRREQLSKIKTGDQVITIGRLHGVVDEINEADKTVTLDCDGIYLVFDLSAIASVKQPAVTAPAADSNANTTAATDDHKDDAASSDSDQNASTDSDAAKDETKSADK